MQDFKKGIIFAEQFKIVTAKIAQLVEHNLAKVRVAGSSPVFRSLKSKAEQVRFAFLIRKIKIKAQVVKLADTLL